MENCSPFTNAISKIWLKSYKTVGRVAFAILGPIWSYVNENEKES